MPANVEVDAKTLQSQLINYRNTAFYTENTGIISNLTSFHFSGQGSYAFGLYQYDPKGNANLVVPAL